MSYQVKASKGAAGVYSGFLPGAGRVVNRRQAQGDPGIFGDIGRFIGGAVKSIPVVGGLVGSGITALANVVDPIKQPTPAIPPMLTPRYPTTTVGGRVPSPGVMGAVERFLPGGETGYERGRPGQSVGGGYRWNKSGYWLKDGTYIEPGTKIVKVRRRNALNPKALDRAMSRVTSAKRASKKLSRVTIRKPAACR